jgi:hypothetical protein
LTTKVGGFSFKKKRLVDFRVWIQSDLRLCSVLFHVELENLVPY